MRRALTLYQGNGAMCGAIDEERMLLGEGDFVLPSPDDDHVGEDVD